MQIKQTCIQLLLTVCIGAFDPSMLAYLLMGAQLMVPLDNSTAILLKLAGELQVAVSNDMFSIKGSDWWVGIAASSHWTNSNVHSCLACLTNLVSSLTQEVSGVPLDLQTDWTGHLLLEPGLVHDS